MCIMHSNNIQSANVKTRLVFATSVDSEVLLAEDVYRPPSVDLLQRTSNYAS